MCCINVMWTIRPKVSYLQVAGDYFLCTHSFIRIDIDPQHINTEGGKPVTVGSVLTADGRR